MLERYLLSAVASKFGHVFEDFDENTTAELSAWRGVLVLRNLHLRKDALQHLGGGGGDDTVDNDDDYFSEDEEKDGDDDDEDIMSQFEEANDDDDSDDDSFQSCSSQIEDIYDNGTQIQYETDTRIDSDEQRHKSSQPPRSTNHNNNGPAIEIVHGSIGSLEIHIPWRLLRASQMENDNTNITHDGDGMRCSAVLSDVRILLAPSNHTRACARGECDDAPNHNNRDIRQDSPSLSAKERRERKLERSRRERELAVQSLLEKELFKLVSGNSPNETSRASPNNGSESKRSRLAKWAKGFVARALASLKVTVQNIHIRYEDEGYGWFKDTSMPSTGGRIPIHQQRRRYRPAFAVGMRLDKFSIRNAEVGEEVNIDASTSPEGMSTTLQLQHKVANVERLSIYWDSSHQDLFVGYVAPLSGSLQPFEVDVDRLYYEKRFDELDILSADVTEGNGFLQHNYLIKPMSPSIHLVMTAPVKGMLGTSAVGPSIQAKLSLPSCSVCFDRNTLEDVAYIRKSHYTSKQAVISIKDHLIEERISRQLSMLHPPPEIRPKGNARLWWKFAIGSVLVLQKKQIYFNERNTSRERTKFKRKGWLGLARLLRLRKEYMSLYVSLWNSSHDGMSTRKQIHDKILALEDLLNNEEIVSFRMVVFSNLSGCTPTSAADDTLNTTTRTNGDMPITESLSLDADEMALDKLSVLSVEYREIKLNHIVAALDTDQTDEKDDLIPDYSVDHDQTNSDSVVLTLSIACQNFNVQANDTMTNVGAPGYMELRRAPIAQSDCSFSLVFNSFRNSSWDVSCSLDSLTVSDLTSSRIDGGCKEQILIGMKQAEENCCDQLSDTRTASVIIRNVRESTSQLHATAFVDVQVSPLEVVYSTNAFEALSRLFAAVKTNEFSKDYERISQALSRWRRAQRKRLMAVLSRRKKFNVSIDIAAPVLMIPEDLQNTDSPTLVIDLGRLTIRSDPSEILPQGFDDKWSLQLSDIRAMCTQQKIASCGAMVLHKHALIEPFSLNFAVLTHIAAATLAGKSIIDVKALLPRLSFNLTTSAVRLVSRLQIRWNDAKFRNARAKQRQTIEDILSTNGGGSPRRQRFHMNILRQATREPTAAPPEATVAPEQELKFSFSAPIIVLRIGNDVGFEHLPKNPKVPLVPLIDLSIRGIGGEYVSNTSHEGVSSNFTSRLRSIHVKDESCFSHVMSSIEPSMLSMIQGDKDCADKDADLVVVQVSKELNSDTDVVIRFHELYVEWNPETFAKVQQSMRLPLSELMALTESSDTSAPVVLNSDEDILQQASRDVEFFDAVDNDHVERPELVPSTKTQQPNFTVSFYLTKLRVNFNKDSQERCLFVAEMNQTHISYFRKPLGGSKTTATIADARIKDPGKTLYGQMIGLQSSSSKSIMQMSFESFPRNVIDDFDGERNFDNMMKVDFSEMKFVYVHQFWLEVFDYFFEGMMGSAVWGSAPKPTPNFSDFLQITRAFKRTRLAINMEQPILLLPVSHRSPEHIRLHLSAFTAASHFNIGTMKGADERLSEWPQWFHNCRVEFCDLDVNSWDESKLNQVSSLGKSSSMVLNVRWPVGPTAPLVKPKWNVVGTVDPLSMRLSRKNFSLFRFFVNYNLSEPSRFLSNDDSLDRVADGAPSNLVLFGYEKKGLPPTTYSISLSFQCLKFHFYVDGEESRSGRSEGTMCVTCTNTNWSLLKNDDCISRQKANVESIHLEQTSGRKDWSGFPDLLLPITSVPDQSNNCLLQFTSTTHPNGDNVKTLHLDHAGIYMIVPAWQHVNDFFKFLPTSPEIFTTEEMSSIMQVGDRFYRMSKATTSEIGRTADCTVLHSQETTSSTTESKEFLFSLTSPRIIFVADATGASDVNSCVTLHMSNLHYHQRSHGNISSQSVICNGLEIFAGQVGNQSSNSSLICPFSICGSLTKTLPLESYSSEQMNGWICMEELKAHAAFTDLTSSLDVLNGFNKQITPSTEGTTNVKQNVTKTVDDSGNERTIHQNGEVQLDVLCSGFSLVVTDDSYRHFANAQPLIVFSLQGLHFSRTVTQPLATDSCSPNQTITFIALDRLELIDLLQSDDSPFRTMATSSTNEMSDGDLLSSFFGVVSPISWEKYKMIQSEWGFQPSPSMETLREAIGHLCAPDLPSSNSARTCDFIFRSLLHGNGVNYIDVSLSHLTAQWNPSTVIALQRFLGRMKKFTTNILTSSSSDNGDANRGDPAPQTTAAPDLGDVVFSVKADIQSICIYLNKEYQKRRILDTKVTGVGIQFERFRDESRLLQGSIASLQVWDPDLNTITSDRNRRILKVINDGRDNQTLQHVFSFQYRTFNRKKTSFRDHEGQNRGMPSPRWVEEKSSSGDIDDFLSINLAPIELNYLRERSAELADYLNNGLPGKGMGATSKAAQSFCESRIKTRSFLDVVIDRPRVFVPRSPSSVTGGCYFSLGTVAIKSWFEEARVQNVTDWYRVLDMKLGLGITVELFEPVTGLESPDTYFDTKLTVMKPTTEKVTQVRGHIETFNVRLSYRDFLMLRLIMQDNVSKPVDESKWENIEKEFWQSEGESGEDVSGKDTGVLYAESARFVRFGEPKIATKESETNFVFLLQSMNITLHRDDWFDNLDEEHASYLCYDICKFSVQNFEATLTKRSNGSKSASFSLNDMSFTDLGDYGRLARDIYLGGNEQKRPPCAFSVVAEGYGESSQGPLISLDIDTEGTSKKIDLKVNTLSITLLPRSIEDVISFGLGKWHCPKLYETNVLAATAASASTDSDAKKSAGSIQFKFLAMYPRLLLLADETDPFSRALVLRGLAVGDINRIHEEVLFASAEFVDIKTTTTLNGHFKELDTRVHQNVDDLIGPNRKLPGSKTNLLGTPLIEPVTIRTEVKNVSRSRFPTTRFLTIEIEPVATLFSFGDVSLIEDVMKKWSKKQKAKAKSTKEKDILNRRRVAPPTLKVAKTHSSQFSKSSDASDSVADQLISFDVVISTRKIGLTLRKSSTTVIVDTSSNPNVQSGDILSSINGTLVGRLPLPYIVNLFESSPRPLTITLQRAEEQQRPYLGHGGSIYGSGMSSSTGFNALETLTTALTADKSGESRDQNHGQEQAISTTARRFECSFKCGVPNGLQIVTGLGGNAVVDKFDLELFSFSTETSMGLSLSSSADVSSSEGNDYVMSNALSTHKNLPLPGAVIVAIDGEEVLAEDALHLLSSYESSNQNVKPYVISFVVADSAMWGVITNFDAMLSFKLTLVDDTSGRDMPVLRTGMSGTSVVAAHGLTTATKRIKTKRPSLLSGDPNESCDLSTTVLTVESEISSVEVEYYNAITNQWEPLIEPHRIGASIERQGQLLNVKLGDHLCKQNMEASPVDFFCINISDSAVGILSRALRNWRQLKNTKQIASVEAQENPNPTLPKSTDGKELKKATKLAKFALDFSRKRGKAGRDDIEKSPFILRNQTGVCISFSGKGVTKTPVRDGGEAQFEMTPFHHKVDQKTNVMNESRFARYDGHFPTLDINLNFEGDEKSSMYSNTSAEPIGSLQTDKVGRSMQRVLVWQKRGDCVVSSHVDLAWTVELEENRRILTLSSSTYVNMYGCGPDIEVGARLSKSKGSTNPIVSVGYTRNGSFCLPVWAESCFCNVAVFIRPVANIGADSNGTSIHEWSSSPILELLETETSDDQEVSFASNTGAIEVHYKWTTKIGSSGGVHCALGETASESPHQQVWMQCTYTEECIQNTASDSVLDDFQGGSSYIKIVTVWPSISIRNMLPCGIEWEIASINEHYTKSTFDSTQLRKERNLFLGKKSPAPSVDIFLQCGSATEIFATRENESELFARFKCIIHGECSWSEWLKVHINGHGCNAKQVNIKCKGPINDSPLTLGVKLSDRSYTESGKGINLILYAEIWLRNLTSLPLTFGAPSFQIDAERGVDSSFPAKINAESALVELTSVLEGSSFGLLGGNDDDADDVHCDDTLNLPLQQSESEVYEEVFEYVSLNDRGEIERKWWASENHIILRQEPDLEASGWRVDCTGDTYLEDGWESCKNIAGAKVSAFGGRRVFDQRHRYRRRRWFRKVLIRKQVGDIHASLSDKVIFHQPADLDQFTRAKREAERNTIGAQLDENENSGGRFLDMFNLPFQQEGILDIMTTVANDGSILINVKCRDGNWSTPAIIPPSGRANGAIRAESLRWPLVKKAVSGKRKDCHEVIDSSEYSPNDPTVFELIYQVTSLSGLWGELSRMVTITPRFLLKNESSWLDIDVKQVGAPDASRLLLPRKGTLPFYWFDGALPELVCARPAGLSGFKWSGGFDLCTLGMLPLRVRQSNRGRNNSNLNSMRVSVELQPGTGGTGTIISIKDEDPDGEGSLFRIENHSPFQIFVSQDGVLANPSLSGKQSSCDSINPGESTSYALDVPWRQGKYEGRTSASMYELLMLRCSLAPLSTREGVESTKVISFSEVGHFIRLSPYKIASAFNSSVTSELLGVRVLGMVGSDGPTRCLRFVLMKIEVTTSSVIGNVVREINPMPTFMAEDSNSPLEAGKSSRERKFLSSCAKTSSSLKAGLLMTESEASRAAFFGTGVCKNADEDSKVAQTSSTNDEYSCELLFSGFAFSFIDSSPTELAVLSLHDVNVGATWDSQRKGYAKSTVVVGWLQLDNHCPGAIYPVALCPRPRKADYDDSEKKPFTAEKPFLELQLDFAPRHRTGIQCLSAGVALRDAFIFIDLAFIMRVQRYLLRLQDHMMVSTGKSHVFVDSQGSWDPPNIDELIKKMTSTTVEVGNKSIFLQRLTILPCKVKLSVAPAQALTKYQEKFEGEEAAAIHAAVRKGDILVGEGSGGLGVKIGGKNQTALAVMQGMLKSILVDALIRCDGASLNFDGVALFNQLSNGQQVSTYLGAHYLASLIANVPSLIGSLAAFGNPVGLMRGVGEGVSDFVNEPVKGFKKSIAEMNPTFVVSGVARGAGSLGRHTVGGLAGSAAMLTETAAKNMAVLTLDRKYAQKRDRLMKLKAGGGKGVNIVRGFESGVQKFIQGILEGVKGVVSKPIKGAAKNGFEGFAKGIGKGLLGLLVKPVIGTTDFLTDSLIGVKGAVESTDSSSYVHNQIRPRRALYGRDRVIRPYKIDDASAATVQARSCLGGEEYYAHVDMVKMVALMSVNQLLILSEDGREVLRLHYQQMKTVEVHCRDDSYFLVIYLNDPKEDGTETDEVNCEDEELAIILRDKIMKVITAII